MVKIGLEFFNSKHELCIVKTATPKYIYVELVNDIAHYKVQRKTFEAWINSGKYVIATEIGKLIYG